MREALFLIKSMSGKQKILKGNVIREDKITHSVTKETEDRWEEELKDKIYSYNELPPDVLNNLNEADKLNEIFEGK